MSGRGTAYVSGASSGIGRGAAVRLAADGYRVVLLGRNEARLAEAAAECGEDARYAAFDVTDPEGSGGVRLWVDESYRYVMVYSADGVLPAERQRQSLAIEPMINIGRPDVEWLDDDWTVVTEDGSLSAHYENTILINEEGEPDILTLGHV